jgi:tetratricopeptide (TPR) repeat protein
MGSVMRNLGAFVLASALAACATPQERTAWTPEMLFGASGDGRDYGDFLSAQYAGMIGDTEAAATYSHRAFTRAPHDPAALEAAVLAYLIEGDGADAARLAARANPVVAESSPIPQITLVADDTASGKLSAARERLQAVRFGAFHAETVSYLSAWLAAADNADAGLSMLDGAAGGRVASAEAQVLRAMILSSAGRPAEALQAIERGPSGRSATAFQIALHARLLASQGQTQAASDLVRDHVAAAGVNPQTGAVAAMLKSGAPVSAPVFGAKDGAAAAIHLAATGRGGRMGSEVAVMRHALALHIAPAFEPALLSMADALEELDRNDQALAVLERVPAASPVRPYALLGSARIAIEMGDAEQGLAATNEAAALSRQRDVLLQAGDLYRGLEKFAEAEAAYGAAIEADAAEGQTDWRVLFARASARERLGRWPDAEADLLAALEVEPDQPDLQNFLGYGWVDRGVKVAEGLRLIESAAAARPDSGHIIDSLGWAQFQLGRYEAAVQHLERAAELAPDEAEIIDHLGDAYWRMGREREAEFQWRRALSFSPDETMQARLREKLASGLSSRSNQASVRARP